MQYDRNRVNNLFEELFDRIDVMRRLAVLNLLLVLVQLLLKAVR
jgi:hypothetical protein